MDLLQKYTEAEKFYELDEAVIETIDELSPSLAAELIKEIQKSIPFLKRKNHRSHIIGGVIKSKTPLFFALRYIYEEDEAPYFFQLLEITSDEYLDLYNLNKII
tara:strand:+ start:1923 stop:2234 length:312 start_codon:yes stop_codon:yes gene_type:complete